MTLSNPLPPHQLKRDHRQDRHWFHYYANCAPCDITYDIVATMETIHEDTRWVHLWVGSDYNQV